MSLAIKLGEEFYGILPCFHALTDSDFTKTFFRRTKDNYFKNMISAPSNTRLLMSLKNQTAIVCNHFHPPPPILNSLPPPFFISPNLHKVSTPPPPHLHGPICLRLWVGVGVGCKYIILC